MADNSVFSESLAYNQQKRRAVSARSFRVKIPPSNSTSFTDGQTIQVDLPGNLAGQYYNMNQMYLKVKVSPTVACTLDRVGALGFIKRLQISTAGAQIADINNYNVLASAMLDTDASSEYKAGYGNVMLGTLGDALKGEDLAAAVAPAERVFCIPMVLNPLSMTTPHRLIPAFALSSLQFRFTLDSAQSAVVSAGAPVLNFSEVEMVCMMTELSPQAQSMVDSSTGGKYNILANSFMNSGATRGGTGGNAVNALTANLGFSVSSLERIIAIHRPSDTVDVQGAYSLGNRGTAGLSEFQYLVNSESYPARPVLIDTKGAESMAETLIADHALADFKKSATFNNGFAAIGAAADNFGVGTSALSGVAPGQAKSACFMVNAPDGLTAGGAVAGGDATPSDIGTFVVATEFESGLSDGKSSTIYSGISTIASVVQWVGKYANATAESFTIDFYAQYTVLLSLDTRGSGVWSISV
jgi:hypothetical protein